MTFNEQIDADISGVFINADEFGEEHNLNGVICTCVIQSPTAKETFISGYKYNPYDNSVVGDTVVIHVGKSLIGEVPTQGQRFDVDGEVYLVSSCVDDMGMLSITLRGHGVGEPL